MNYFLHIDLDHNNILNKIIDLSLQLVWLPINAWPMVVKTNQNP